MVVVIIFVLIIGVSFYATFYARQSFETMLEMTEKAKHQPFQYSEEIVDYWNVRADVLCVFVKNAPIDELSRLCSRLPEAAKAEDKADYDTILLEIEECMRQIYYGEIPRWYNVL